MRLARLPTALHCRSWGHFGGLIFGPTSNQSIAVLLGMRLGSPIVSDGGGELLGSWMQLGGPQLYLG